MMKYLKVGYRVLLFIYIYLFNKHTLTRLYLFNYLEIRIFILINKIILILKV